MATEEEIWELVIKTIGEDKLKELKSNIEGVTESAAKMAEQGEQGAKKTGDFGRAALEGSRALEDLQYGIGGVLNNIPSLVMALGGPAGLAGIISVTAVAAKALYDHWDDLTGAFEEKQPFPKAANDISGMNRELDRAKDAMEKLEKAGKGNAKQLEEYNRLSAETARLEKEIADQQERQNLLKKLRGGVSEEQEGRAKGFAEAVKGTDIEAKLKEAYQHDIDNEIETARVGMALRIQAAEASGATDEERAKVVKEESEKYSAVVRRLRDPANDPAKLAEDLFVRLGKGEELAGAALDRLMKESGVYFGDLAKRMEAANPVIKKQMDEALKEIEEVAKIEIDAAQKQKTAAEKALDAELKAVLDQATAEQAAAKKKQTATTKAAEHALDVEMKAVLDQTEETHKQHEAEAKRIHLFTGEGAGKQFGATVAGQAMRTGGDPEKIAAVLAGQLARQFRGAGATAGGAGLAAQQIAGQAGFRVARPQLNEREKAAQQTQEAMATTQQAMAESLRGTNVLITRSKNLNKTAQELLKRAKEASTTAQNNG